jgi:hypothetical protein
MPARLLWLLLGIVVLLLVGASVLTGDGAIVAASAVFLLFVVGFAVLNLFLARHQRDSRTSTADRDDAVPSAHMSPEPGADDRPLGDTPEAHDEISPHDLPVGHPGRAAAERQAGGELGTTQGHADGGAAGQQDEGVAGGRETLQERS